MTIPLFNNGEKVPVFVEDDPQNIVYIKARMSYADEQKCMGASTRVIGKQGQAAEDAEAAFDMGTYNMLFLKTNILGWEGPLFEGIVCNAANIERMNAGHPLFDKVLAEISARNNTNGAARSPNGSVEVGSISSKESAESQPETTTSISPSLTASE